ncbi:tetratricopeptide repeat protein [Altererythrobacter indicus]|uniref:Tetratricopeptide repeat protein n=1 Tax=Altericroceibacterium indicum TaxID=374177 RepID=A0A845A8C4_9SPHN|nr:tetratricopeptide repeat protein [Altericroceibacterium indicum]MXP25787.1 tetratricopeptide repeat protein [Altericroceibacterium indicum]
MVRHLTLAALCSISLGGCTTASIERADTSASTAQVMLAQGKHGKAVRHAEAAVRSEPNNPAYRAILGKAYLDSGRFLAAATTLQDALTLGDHSNRTTLQLALALIGSGQAPAAIKLLDQRSDSIDPADAGLAFALAGDTRRGIATLSVAIRSGVNNPRIRQNLALAYALAGQWREARALAAQDVPPDQLGTRMEQWAAMALAQQPALPIAQLLDVKPDFSDRGQPVELALVRAHSPYLAHNEAPPSELANVEPPHHRAQRAIPQTSEKKHVSAEAAPALVAETAPAQFTRSAPLSSKAAPLSEKTPASTHLIQLGSFTSESDARRAWGSYQAKWPALKGHALVMTKARVSGKTYWRVAANGFDQTTAASTCQSFQAGGQGCLAYSKAKPLPGTIATVATVAMR